MWFILLNIAFATAALAGNNIVDGGGTAELFEMDDTYLMETVRMIRSIYIEVISNIPFSSHRALVDLQRLNGVKIGNYDDSYSEQQAIWKWPNALVGKFMILSCGRSFPRTHPYR